MIDRLRFPGEALEGGKPGAAGEFLIDEVARPQPKVLVSLSTGSRVQLNLPGGGGYGDPFEREASAVLEDVAKGYVSIESAERDYGVAIRYRGRADQLVRLPEHFAIDEAATRQLRARSPKH